MQVLKLLSRFNADLGAAAADGSTPAFVASQKGHAKVLRVLGELFHERLNDGSNAGLNLDSVTADGRTLCFF